MAAQIVADNFAIEQIKNWRQIEFLVMHLERSKMCYEEVRQVAAVLSEGISALVPELLVLSVLAFLFQHQGIQFF